MSMDSLDHVVEQIREERDTALTGRTTMNLDGVIDVYEVQRQLAAVTERAEKAERKLGELEFAFDGVELSGARKLREQIATLTRERDEANEFFDTVKVESDTFRVETDRLTRELEAERAGSAQYRQTLETIRFLPAVSNPKYCSLMHAAHLATQALEFSTVGTETLSELNTLREFKRLQGSSGLAVVNDLAERLRKAEADRDKFASCWAKAETALNDMEIAKDERITTLEAALASERETKILAVKLKLKAQGELDEVKAALEEARKALEHIEDLAAHTDWAAASSHAHAAHERIGRLTP